MIKYSLLLLCSLLLGASSNNKELFFEANNLHNKKEYTQASKIYELIEHPGWGVFYNNGLCYEQQLNYVMALYNFYKADKLNPHDTIIQQALQRVHKNLATHQELPGTLSQCLALLQRHYVLWNSILLALCIIFLITNICLISTKRVIYSFICLVFIVVCLYTHNNYLSKYDYCILLKDKRVYSINNQSSELITTITRGTRLIIKQTLPGWYKISNTYKEGWVTKDETLVV